LSPALEGTKEALAEHLSGNTLHFTSCFNTLPTEKRKSFLSPYSLFIRLHIAHRKMTIESSVPKDMTEAINKMAETTVNAELDVKLPEEPAKATQHTNCNEPSYISSVVLAKKTGPPFKLWVQRYFTISQAEPIPVGQLKGYFNKYIKDVPCYEYAAANKVLFTNMASALTGAKGLLLYFKNDKQEVPLGIINLRHVTEVKVVEEAPKPTVDLVTEDRTYRYRTMTQESLRNLVATLQKVKEELSHDTVGDSEDFKSWVDKLNNHEDIFADKKDESPAEEQSSEQEAKEGGDSKSIEEKGNHLIQGSKTKFLIITKMKLQLPRRKLTEKASSLCSSARKILKKRLRRMKKRQNLNMLNVHRMRITQHLKKVLKLLQKK
jgi:hypothetical protein